MGASLVSLVNVPKKPRQDIILPICYRNSPWALVTAHALGSGIYREETLVQHPDDPILWTEIGYEVSSGELKPGKPVSLKRSAEASPEFFKELMKAEDAVRYHRYSDQREQFSEVAKMIHDDIKTGELYPHDIAVVFPDALSASDRGITFIRFLMDLQIEAHMVGVTSSKDSFSIEGSVAVSGPFRAKGNEAPMVYVMDSDFCARGPELIKRRNILFTAITRSRGWVRICGCGNNMDKLCAEFEKLKKENFQLSFSVPTPEELKRMRTVFRDITSNDKKIAMDLKKILDQLPSDPEEAGIVLQSLPKSLREKIILSLRGSMDD